MSNDKVMRLAVNDDVDFIRAVKLHCVERDLTVKEFLRMAIEKELVASQSPYLDRFKLQYAKPLDDGN